jgi:microcystin-dependent protein
MPFYLWSKTSSSNATADPTINYAEGQAPSSLNDSARATMARLSEYRDDIAGSIVTTGSSTAYAVATNEVFDTLAHMNGQMVAFVPHVVNGATVTFNVDGLGAVPLRPQPGVDLPAGVLLQGTPYVATYNNAQNAWYLHGLFGNPYNIPIGGMMPYTGSTPPNSNFAFPAGQALSRTTYATLFALNGTTFGAGDGSTTFNIIDLRGRIPVPQDNMNGVAAGRITGASGINGSVLGAAGGAETVTLDVTMIPAHAHSATDVGHTHGFSSNDGAGSLVRHRVDGGAGGTSFLDVGSITSTFTIAPASANITVGNNGGGLPHTNMPPAIIVPWILRVI